MPSSAREAPPPESHGPKCVPKGLPPGHVSPLLPLGPLELGAVALERSQPGVCMNELTTHAGPEPRLYAGCQLATEMSLCPTSMGCLSFHPFGVRSEGRAIPASLGDGVTLQQMGFWWRQVIGSRWSLIM